MRVLIAPDKFKGSLTAPQAANAMAAGVREVYPSADIDLCPLSDGGEGFVAAMVAARADAQRVAKRVVGPLPEMAVEADFAVLGDTAVMEMSSAAGLLLLAPDLRNPLATTTFGVGQLLRHAAELGCRQTILGIGGSATCDAGIGCLQGCGCHVVLAGGGYASDGEPLCGRDMDDVVLIKHGRGSPVDGMAIRVACDVTAPLFGPSGAACVFAPQKGASPQDVLQLDRMLRDLAARLSQQATAMRPGAGAAGGLGFGLAAVLDATLEPGADLVLEALAFEQRLAAADVVLTGEGCFDATSLTGKVTGRVLRRAAGKALLLAGRIDQTPAAPHAALLRPDESEAAAMAAAAERLSQQTSDLLRRVRARRI